MARYPSLQVCVNATLDVWLIEVPSKENIALKILLAIYKVKIGRRETSDYLSQLIHPFEFEIGFHAHSRGIVYCVLVDVVLFSTGLTPCLWPGVHFPLSCASYIERHYHDVLDA